MSELHHQWLIVDRYDFAFFPFSELKGLSQKQRQKDQQSSK